MGALRRRATDAAARTLYVLRFRLTAAHVRLIARGLIRPNSRQYDPGYRTVRKRRGFGHASMMPGRLSTRLRNSAIGRFIAIRYRGESRYYISFVSGAARCSIRCDAAVPTRDVRPARAMVAPTESANPDAKAPANYDRKLSTSPRALWGV